MSPQSISESTTSTPSMTVNSSSGGQMSPISPLHSNSKYSATGLSTSNASNTIANGSVDAVNNSLNGSSGNGLKSPIRTEKPIQKVIPSRNSTPIKYQQQQIASPTNGNPSTPDTFDGKTKDYGIYMKPTSPTKLATSANGTMSIAASAIKSNGSTKTVPKITR